jgi:DeoR/GlpR family transcriptional regulator of sugar metabolism
MLLAERQKRILDLINRNGGVSTNTLADTFRASLPTVRRDLEILSRQGLIVRTHGGAVSHAHSPGQEPLYRQKVQLRAEEKERIGRAAATLITEQDTIIFDSGSTTFQVARSAHGKVFTAVTLDLPMALELADDSKIEVLVAGGKARTGLYSLVGPLAESMLGQLHVHRFFLGADAVDLAHGVTNATAAEVPVKRMAIQAAQEVILVADSSKFQTRTLMDVCRLEDIQHIITDRGLAPEIVRALRRKHIRLTIV